MLEYPNVVTTREPSLAPLPEVVRECSLQLPQQFQYWVEGQIAECNLTYMQEQVGHYCINSSILCFVGAKGDVFVTFASDEIVSELRNSGFRESQLQVPLSHGEMPTNYQLRDDWTKIIKEGREQEQARWAATCEAAYASCANTLNLRDVDTTLSFRCDGVIFKDVFEAITHFPDRFDRNLYRDRLKMVGQYQVTEIVALPLEIPGQQEITPVTHVIAYVNERGEYFLRPYSDNFERLLIKANYTRITESQEFNPPNKEGQGPYNLQEKNEYMRLFYAARELDQML